MAYEITVGPAQLTINSGQCVLISETDGRIRQPSERGLFWQDTRLVSEWEVRIDGQPWQLLSSAATTHFGLQVLSTNPVLAKDEGEVPAGTMSLAIGRVIDETGMRETLTVRNHHLREVRVALGLRIASDFADLFDVKSHRLVGRGSTATRWDEASATAETVHENEGFRRGISIGPAPGCARPSRRDGTFVFDLVLASQAVWSTDLDYRVIDGEKVLAGSEANFAGRHGSRQERALADWRSQAVRLETPHDGLRQLFEQSLDDLAALRLPIECANARSFVPAAGIPWFAALFGRDSIVTALQTLPIYPDFARGALEVLARYQADGYDDSRDMQPGKIAHELRHGELARLGLVPYTPYYGTADATPLYIVLLHRTWQFTGDRSLLEQHLGTAERCLEWIDADGDLDGDGFQEYRRRTEKGAENQGWKDSGNGVLREDGTDVPAPKALCELQGYVYDAWLRMAEIYDTVGQDAKAAGLREKAEALFERFNEVFWDEGRRAYALCLDPDKKRVMTVASNMGHLLWSGIVPEERARDVRDRLMADDMWSGWGVRTMSADHPAYNPHDYQLGSIWPHDNAIIALGLRRYGFAEDVARIAGGLVEAASRFDLHRLPEVFAGTDRKDVPFPVQYLGANVPQAWAAGSVFSLVHAMLGLSSDVGAGVLFADPALPEWLGEVTLRDVSVGARNCDVRFVRNGEATRAELVRDDGVKLETRRWRG